MIFMENWRIARAVSHWLLCITETEWNVKLPGKHFASALLADSWNSVTYC
jgi:hypothetical protein